MKEAADYIVGAGLHDRRPWQQRRKAEEKVEDTTR